VVPPILGNDFYCTRDCIPGEEKEDGGICDCVRRPREPRARELAVRLDQLPLGIGLFVADRLHEALRAAKIFVPLVHKFAAANRQPFVSRVQLDKTNSIFSTGVRLVISSLVVRSFTTTTVLLRQGRTSSSEPSFSPNVFKLAEPKISTP
jgi:hypothetical protein